MLRYFFCQISQRCSMIREHAYLIGLVLLACSLTACGTSLQRGMLGDAYVSSARPTIMIQAKDLPLLTAGNGLADLTNTSAIAGLPIRVWLALYGEGLHGPLAVVAQAQVPHGWYWDSILRRPFSVNERIELLGGIGFQACTFIVDGPHDPFISQSWSESTEDRPKRWLVRAFAARCNFDEDKIILEYREPLPPYMDDLTSIPYGHDDVLLSFEQRAREAFVFSPLPDTLEGVRSSYPQGIQWRYMRERFLGTASKYDILDIR